MLEMTDFQRNLQEKCPDIVLLFEEPLKKHTSFRIGGPCEVFAQPKSMAELKKLLSVAAELGEMPCILGSGTNVLARDEGRRGLVISTKDALTELEDTPEGIRAGAGVSMAKLANYALSLGRTGLEFAHGIPGSVGGGLYMNAGAYGGEMAQVAVQTAYLKPDGQISLYTGPEQGFSYRKSAFSDQKGVILWGLFSLDQGDQEEIRNTMQALMAKRKASQPLELPSAGSTFKRPKGGYAAALIEEAGLKGFRIGDAAVSEKHAGFVVNLGNATAENVLDLVQEIQKRVLDHSGIMLEPEIRMI